MTTLGERLIRSAQEARKIARGSAESARAHIAAAIDVAAIRRKTGLSQPDFAERFGFSLDAVRDWEQRRRNPEPAARTLLTIIDREPEAVERALSAA